MIDQETLKAVNGLNAKIAHLKFVREELMKTFDTADHIRFVNTKTNDSKLIAGFAIDNADRGGLLMNILIDGLDAKIMETVTLLNRYTIVFDNNSGL